MAYRFLDDIATADAAFEAAGATLEELCIAAADALMNIMVDNLDSIVEQRVVGISVEAESVDLLLFRLLDELVYYKDAERLLLRIRGIELRRKNESLFLRARAYGEEINPERHHLVVDIKAVTMHMYRVEETAEGWKARVVVDI